MTATPPHGHHLTAAEYPHEQEMSVSEPLKPTEGLPPGSGAVQRKVSAASVASYVGGLALVAVVQSLQDGSLIAALPPVASAILAPLVPSLLVFLAGYMTTNKVDADAAKRFAASVMAEIAMQVETRVAAQIDKHIGGSQ